MRNRFILILHKNKKNDDYKLQKPVFFSIFIFMIKNFFFILQDFYFCLSFYFGKKFYEKFQKKKSKKIGKKNV